MEIGIFLGVALHALGGLVAASCFVPQQGTPRWSFQSFFLLMVFVSWFVMPIVVAFFTVPDLMQVIQETPVAARWKITLLGALYGFGGMSFAVAIQYIGYSLTYAVAIGISAVVGTLLPQLLAGTLSQDYAKPGGMVILAGFVISVVGVAVLGKAGFLKEKELGEKGHPDEGHTIRTFDMKKGLSLAMFSGVLSGIFGLSLAQGASMDALAAEHGAGNFQGNAKFIFAMGGAFITNVIWWTVVHLRRKTFGEYVRKPEGGNLGFYWVMGILAGVLWYLQFLFYGLAHVRMSDYGFISWGIHMAMLIFFSFGIGLILKEWAGCSKKTVLRLGVGLALLILSFAMISYGSWQGSQVSANDATRSSNH